MDWPNSMGISHLFYSFESKETMGHTKYISFFPLAKSDVNNPREKTIGQLGLVQMPLAINLYILFRIG
jgi:hypothetical protein